MGLAESMTEFKKEIATILGDAVLGESVSDRSANLAFLGASFLKCKNFAEARDQQKDTT